MKVDFGLSLAPLDRAYLETIRAWRNDYSIWRWCRQSDLISDASQEAWFERQAADPTIKMYVVVRSVDGKADPVGVCGLTSLDWLNRRAEFSLYVAPEHQRKGYATEALSLLLAHGFQNLGLVQIWGESLDGNPAIKIFEAKGFKKDGTRRAFYFKDGAFHDAHLYSIFGEEWLDGLRASRSLARGAAPDALSPLAEAIGRRPADTPATGAEDEAQAKGA